MPPSASTPNGAPKPRRGEPWIPNPIAGWAPCPQTPPRRGLGRVRGGVTGRPVTLYLKATKHAGLIQFEEPFRASCVQKQSLWLKILPRSCMNLQSSSSSHQQPNPMSQSHSPICLAYLLPVSNLSFSLLLKKCKSFSETAQILLETISKIQPRLGLYLIRP